MNCKHCNHVLPEDSNVCQNCGQFLDTSSEANKKNTDTTDRLQEEKQVRSQFAPEGEDNYFVEFPQDDQNVQNEIHGQGVNQQGGAFIPPYVNTYNGSPDSNYDAHFQPTYQQPPYDQPPYQQSPYDQPPYQQPPYQDYNQSYQQNQPPYYQNYNGGYIDPYAPPYQQTPYQGYNQPFNGDLNVDQYISPKNKFSTILKAIIIIILILCIPLAVYGIYKVVTSFVSVTPIVNKSDDQHQDESIQMSLNGTRPNQKRKLNKPRIIKPSGSVDYFPAVPERQPSDAETEQPNQPATPGSNEHVLTITDPQGYVIRSGPGTNYGKIGSLQSGDKIPVIGIVSGQEVSGFGNQWYEISVQGKKGYIIKDSKGQQ